MAACQEIDKSVNQTQMSRNDVILPDTQLAESDETGLPSYRGRGFVNPICSQSTDPPSRAPHVTADFTNVTTSYDDDESFVHPLYGRVPPRRPVPAQQAPEIRYNNQLLCQQQQQQPQVMYFAYNYQLHNQMHQQQPLASQIGSYQQQHQQQPERQQPRAQEIGSNNQQQHQQQQKPNTFLQQPQPQQPPILATGYNHQLQQQQQQQQQLLQQQQFFAIYQLPMNAVVYEEPAPPDFMYFAVFVTLFCCNIFGAVAMYQAAASRVSYAKGNIAGAKDQGKRALGFSIASLVIGIALIITTAMINMIAQSITSHH